MKLLSYLLVVAMLVAPVWATPVWEADKTYNADSGLKPSQSGGTFTPWIVASSGSTSSTIQLKDGKNALFGYENKFRHVHNSTAQPLDFQQELWIEWTVWVDDNPDTHQGPSLSIIFDGTSMDFMSDGNFSGWGSWNAQKVTILDGTGMSDGLRPSSAQYAERLNAPKNAWHTISAHVIPKSMSGSGGVEVEFSIDGGVDDTPGTDVVGNDTDYARYLMTGNGQWDKASSYGINVGNGLLSFGSGLTTASSKSYDLGTHEIKWTQIPEPAALVLLGLSGLFILRRGRA